MRLVCISDLHGHLPEDLPSGDALLISGDICPTVNHEYFFQRIWLKENFNNWLKRLPYRMTFLCAGNHDFIFERSDIGSELACIYMKDSGYEWEGLKFWGTPWQPWFYDWAFNAPRQDYNEKFLREKFDLIPEGTDVLLSHGPPRMGSLDVVGTGSRRHNVGSTSLADRIRHIKPKLTVCGHLHDGYGEYEFDGCRVVNASYLDEDYLTGNDPIVVEI